MNDSTTNVKFKAVLADKARSSWQKYRSLYYGDCSICTVLRAELTFMLCSGTPGAWGLWLRSKLYPGLFKSAGKGVVFGRSITLRHAHKITLGCNVIVDDNCVLDAKGDTNSGIEIGDNVYIGRNTVIYCKSGDIRISNRCNIGAYCQLFSGNKLSLAEGVIIGAYSYLLSGGAYDYKSSVPFCEQDGNITKGPLTIGENTWVGAGVLVLDAASVGKHCVIGAGAVVTSPLPDNTVAAGIPATVKKQI